MSETIIDMSSPIDDGVVDAAPPKKARSSNPRINFRVSPEFYDRIAHFANQKNMSINAFVQTAVDHYIDWILGDFDLPNAEIKRLNQVVDGFAALSKNVGNLERVVIALSDSMMMLSRGDNYLLDEEDGEL